MQQLSVYLDVADSVTLPQGWSRQAHFSLTVQNQKEPQRSVVKDADHHFTLRACDWGFREFVPLTELKDSRTGFLMDDKLVISARVRVEPLRRWSVGGVGTRRRKLATWASKTRGRPAT